MNVYRISINSEVNGKLMFDGELLSKSLGNIRLLKLDSLTSDIKDKWPDCYGWFCSMSDGEALDSQDLYLWKDSILILSERAKKLFYDISGMHGEYLDFACGEETYSLFICHAVVPEDSKNSELVYDDGVPRAVSKLAFREKDVGSNILFKTSFDSYTALYCTDQFKSIVEKSKLGSIVFEMDLAHNI